MTSTKILNFFSIAIVMLALLFTIVGAVWLTYPYKTIAFHNIPFPMAKYVYKPGDCLQVYTKYTRYTDLPCTAIARYTDGITFTTLPVVFQKTPGEFDGISMSLRIPDVLPPGKYYLDICFTYQVNPIRSIVINAKTQEFIVTDHNIK